MDDEKPKKIANSKSQASLGRFLKCKLERCRSFIISDLQDHNDTRKDRTQEEKKNIMDILETKGTKMAG